MQIHNEVQPTNTTLKSRIFHSIGYQHLHHILNISKCSSANDLSPSDLSALDLQDYHPLETAASSACGSSGRITYKPGNGNLTPHTEYHPTISHHMCSTYLSLCLILIIQYSITLIIAVELF